MPIKRKLNIDSGIRTNNKNYGKTIRTITDFLNNEYKEYSNYVISSRALPSIMDGFKTGARKVMHAAFHGGLKDGSEKKLLNLVGDVYNKTLFAHGDAGMISSIMTMGQDFASNLNPLEIVGQYGSLRDPNSYASPRYLFCKLSKYAHLYKIDEDLLEYVFDEGEYLEPHNYLPIIPLVLCQRNSGMAPGYKFQTFSYSPIDIIDACLEIIKNGKIKTLIRPYVRGIKSDKFVYDKETKRWWNIGTWEIDEKNDILHIKDLPYDVSFEKFEKKLNSYIDNEYIKDWKNFSHDDVIDYRVLFGKGKIVKEVTADKKEAFLKKFMLQTLIPEDLLYVLDENKKVKHFMNKEELILHFVKIRQEKYNSRKDKLVEVKKQQLKDNEDLCKFIELVSSGKLKINNRKMSDVKEDMKKYDLPDRLLQVQISKLTEEEKQNILKKSGEIQKELEYIQNTTIEQMYIDDLKKLKKELDKDFQD